MQDDKQTPESVDEISRLKEANASLIRAADTPEYSTLGDIIGATYILRCCLDQYELPLYQEAIPLLRQIAEHIEAWAVHQRIGTPAD
jgi:hypothetical protein